MINLHVYPSPITNESRIEREVASIERLGIFSSVEVAGVSAPGLPETGFLGESASVRRFASEADSHGLRARSGKTVAFGRDVFKHYSSLPLSVINCHSVSALPACIALKRASGARLVYDTHELETEASAASRLRKPAYKIAERIGIRSVDHTFTVSESIEEWYRITYGLTCIDTIYNYPSEEQMNQESDRDYFRKLYGIPDSAQIYLYQGVFGEGRGLEAIADAFRRSLIQNGFLVLLGYGPMEGQVRDWAQECDRVLFHPSVPPQALAGLTRAADVGLVPTIGAECLSYYYSAPNKMFQYWHAGIPVIASDLPEHRRFLNRYPAGVLASSNSPESFVDACSDLRRQDPNRIAGGLRRAKAELRWESYEDLFRARYADLARLFPEEK